MGDSAAPGAPRKHPGGKPLTIDDETLQRNRDCLIVLLSDSWADIGWSLMRVRTSEDVRRVLRLIQNPTAEERLLLEPFVRETKGDATAGEIRATQKALEAARQREADLQVDGSTNRRQVLADRVLESKLALRDAWRSDDPDRFTLRDLHTQRATALAVFRREMDGAHRTRTELEQTLSDEEASFAQRELSAFIAKGKYRWTPRTVARAMAGPPFIGAGQSHRRCSWFPEKPHLWPTFRYRVFTIIHTAWRDRTDLSKDAFLARVAKGVRRIPVTDTDDQSFRREHLRQYFVQNWWFLKQAVAAVEIEGGELDAVPYDVVSDFQRRVTNATDRDRVLADADQLSIVPPVARTSKTRRSRIKS